MLIRNWEELSKIPMSNRTSEINEEVIALQTENAELEKNIELANQRAADTQLDDIAQSNKIASLITWATINNEHIYNVHWPLFFSIRFCMHKFANEVVASYQRRENDRGFFGSIKEFFTDEDKNATMRAINELQESEQTLAQILNEENKNCLYLI